MNMFANLFGMTENTEAKEMLEKGAIVIDVRTPAEFSGGHVKGSKNIPLNEVQSRLKEIKELNKPVVLCCASGNRSGNAASFLKQQGVECTNGGSWGAVQKLKNDK